VQSGWYSQRFSDYVGDAGFAWNINRSAFIGKCVFHTPRNQFISVLRSGEIQKISGVNLARDADELIGDGVEIWLRSRQPGATTPVWLRYRDQDS
jgi:hypothetical protein